MSATTVPVTPVRATLRGVVARVGLLGGLTVALAVILVLSAGTGQLDIPRDEVLGSLLHKIGLDIGPLPSHPQGENTLWQVRFPRVVMAAIAGAALATAGALMQGVFGNPLAEPGVVGVSSGAAVAAAAVIVFGWTFAGSWTVALCAFLGGLITTTLVYLMSRDGGRTEVVTLVLTGIALNAMTSAGLAFMMFLGDTQAREEIVFWQLGSLNGSRWEYVGVVAPLALVGIVAAMLLAPKLDLLALGDRAARHVGVDVERLRIGTIVVVAVLTAAAVSFCGIIAFVGLVVPHLIRLIAGPGHRLLVPASALGGAVLLVAGGPVGPHRRRVRRPADRHAHLADRRPVLLLAAAPRAPYRGRLGMSVLSAHGVSVTIDGSPIVADVDLDVAAGEVVVLVGPNGAGKSTLLSVLSGDVDPTSGTSSWPASTSATGTPASWPGCAASRLQKQGLAFGFRVREVVRMGRSPWHRTEAAERDDVAVEDSMVRADVTELADRLFPTLSGGEQARTSFARLLAQETPVLMLDEPTAALDIRHQEQLLGVVRDVAAAGAAVVVVLHDLSLAAAYADRVCVLANGRVRADGPPAEVLTGELLTEVYGHPVDVIHHDGALIVVPVRPRPVAALTDTSEEESSCSAV